MRSKANPLPTAEKAASKRGGRPRKGGLIQRNGQWYGRFRTEVDGETIRVVRALGTDSRAVAKSKLARLMSSELALESAGEGETFEQAARRVNDGHRDVGVKNWKRELARLEHHIFPVIGSMPAAAIRARHINELLEGVRLARRRGKEPPPPPAHGTLKHILTCVSLVLDDLWRKEVLAENVARSCEDPKGSHEHEGKSSID